MIVVISASLKFLHRKSRNMLIRMMYDITLKTSRLLLPEIKIKVITIKQSINQSINQPTWYYILYFTTQLRAVLTWLSKVIAFALSLRFYVSDWLKKLGRCTSCPIRGKTKTSQNLYTHVFPRFTSSFDWFARLSVSFMIG